MNNLKAFKILKQLKQNKLLSAIFESTNCSLELTDDENLIGRVSPEKSGFKIVLNPNKMKNDSMTFFVLCHEIMHVYFSHFNLMRENKMLDNISKDYAINYFLAELLKKSESDLMDYGGVCFSFLVNELNINKKILLDKIDNESDSMTVYDALSNLLKNDSKQDTPNSFCQTDAQDLDNKDKKRLLAEKLENELKNDSELLEKLESIENKMRLNKSDDKTQGNNQSQGIARIILDKINGPSSKQIAKILLTRVIQNNASRFTQKKSSRRDDSLPARIKEKNNSVCFVVDTSGSITDENLALINGIIDESAKIASITIRCGDTDLKNEIKLNKNQRLKKSDFFIGGGGTDLNFARQDNDNFLHYLIFTDGYIPEFSQDFKRTLFIFESGKFVDSEKCYRLK